MPAIASATVAYARRSSSDTYCGGASSISPAACAASASSGPNHWISSVSAPSAIAVAARDGADEEPRREPLRRDLGRRPVREVHERVGVDVDARFFLRLTGRGTARGRVEIVGVVAVVVGIDATAGEHPRAAVELQASTTASPSNTSRPSSPSRSSTTVAAGAASTPRRRCAPRTLAPFLNPAVRQRGRPSRAGRAAPSCRTCRPTSSAPRR